MDYKYFPHTESDLKAMLDKVGVKDLNGLYAQIPDAIRYKNDYQLPSEMSELEVRQLFDKLGSQNQQMTCFAGYGVYDHYTPSVIPSLLQRSEFLTSYTPYQAEISQGTLHYIFEYRTPAEMDDVLYAEPSLQGNAVIAHRTADSAETQTNVELLFNAVTQGQSQQREED